MWKTILHVYDCVTLHREIPFTPSLVPALANDKRCTPQARALQDKTQVTVGGSVACSMPKAQPQGMNIGRRHVTGHQCTTGPHIPATLCSGVSLAHVLLHRELRRRLGVLAPLLTLTMLVRRSLRVCSYTGQEGRRRASGGGGMRMRATAAGGNETV